MNFSEYKEKSEEIISTFNKKQAALNKEFALSNNTQKVGDLITDHIGTIKIEQIKWGGIVA